MIEKTVPENLKKRMSDVTEELKDIISEIQKNELIYTQDALNFIDNINVLSVSY